MQNAVCSALPKTILIQNPSIKVSPRQVPKYHQHIINGLGVTSERGALSDFYNLFKKNTALLSKF